MAYASVAKLSLFETPYTHAQVSTNAVMPPARAHAYLTPYAEGGPATNQPLPPFQGPVYHQADVCSQVPVLQPPGEPLPPCGSAQGPFPFGQLLPSMLQSAAGAASLSGIPSLPLPFYAGAPAPVAPPAPQPPVPVPVPAPVPIPLGPGGQQQHHIHHHHRVSWDDGVWCRKNSDLQTYSERRLFGLVDELRGGY